MINCHIEGEIATCPGRRITSSRPTWDSQGDPVSKNKRKKIMREIVYHKLIYIKICVY
jgi:hypothetical protein